MATPTVTDTEYAVIMIHNTPEYIDALHGLIRLFPGSNETPVTIIRNADLADKSIVLGMQAFHEREVGHEFVSSPEWDDSYRAAAAVVRSYQP